MTLEQRLSRLRRDDDRSLTQQLVDLFTAAIDSGELAPGAKLPPTRRLADLAGVNQLTASRAYHRLQQRGLVLAGVGRGTFVRQGAPAQVPADGAPLDPRGAGDRRASWQAYALPEPRDGYGGRIIAELTRQAVRPDLIALSAGYLAEELFPLAQLEAATADALSEEGARCFQYGSVEGVEPLREQLAAHGRSRGLQDGAQDIIVTTGARQALAIAARAVLRPGDVAACESPTFMGIIEALRLPGVRLLGVPVDDEGLDTDALELLARRHELKLLALQPRLHNPTGADLSKRRREHLLELARRYGFFVVEDGVYGDLRLDGRRLAPLRAADPDHVIYLESLSKTVSPGLRIGWIAASGAVRERMVSEKRDDDGHSPTLSQYVAARYLAGGDHERQLERVRADHTRRRDVLIAALSEQLDGLATFTRPPGGGHVWLTLNEPVDEADLYRAALGRGVAFIPGSAMLLERGPRTQLRLSFSMLPPDRLVEGVRRLGEVIRELEPRTATPRALPLS